MPVMTMWIMVMMMMVMMMMATTTMMLMRRRVTMTKKKTDMKQDLHMSLLSHSSKAQISTAHRHPIPDLTCV